MICKTENQVLILVSMALQSYGIAPSVLQNKLKGLQQSHSKRVWSKVLGWRGCRMKQQNTLNRLHNTFSLYKRFLLHDGSREKYSINSLLFLKKKLRRIERKVMGRILLVEFCQQLFRIRIIMLCLKSIVVNWISHLKCGRVWMGILWS